jgi:hypothetical protein
MKTLVQVTVGGIAALAIAFAAFRVGAYFETAP